MSHKYLKKVTMNIYAKRFKARNGSEIYGVESKIIDKYKSIYTWTTRD